MSNDLTFKDVWEKLSKVGVSKFCKEKGKLTYLSWGRCWMLLMQHYPQAEYEFVVFEGSSYRTLADGTAEVVTIVKIDNLIRTMALPVMDYKSNPVVNPTSTQVNTNRMRCLVKNIAMFGLGMSIYASLEPEDLEVDTDESEPDPKHDEQPKDKKTAPKKKPSKEDGLDIDAITEEAKVFDEAWADVFVEGLEKLLVVNDTKKMLAGFYKEQAEGISRLKRDFPEHKKQLDEVFVKHADSLDKNDQETATEEQKND